MVSVTKLNTWGPTKLQAGQYELRVRLFLDDGTKREPRPRFPSLGRANKHKEQLEAALHHAIDPKTGRRWGWSADLKPTLLEDPVTLAASAADETLWTLVCAWRTATWGTSSGNGRSTAAAALRMAVRYFVTAPLGPDADAYVTAVAFRQAKEPDLGELQDRYPDGSVIYRVGNIKRSTTVATLWRGRQQLEVLSLPVVALDRDRLRDYVAHLATGREANTERRYWSVLQGALSWAAEEHVNGMPRAPRALAAGIKLRPARAQDVQDVGPVPDENELWAFAEACATAPHNGSRERWRALPLVMGGAGLRIGECAALTRRDITERSTDGTDGLWIHVRRNLANPGRDYTDSGEAWEVRGTKKKGPHGNVTGRTTFLPAAESKVLRAHLDRFVGADADAVVFTGARGGRLDESSLLDLVWSPAKEQAFPARHRLQKMTPHGLRHLAATRWLRSGLPLTTAARWGGWSDTATMLRFYDSVLPHDDESAADIMNRAADQA